MANLFGEIPNFQNWAELDTWYANRNLPLLNTTNTNYPSQFTAGMLAAQIRFDPNESKNKGSSEIARYLQTFVSGCAPIKLVIWLNQKSIIQRSISFLTTNVEALQLKAEAKKYMAVGSKCADPQVILDYQKVAKEWRKQVLLPVQVPGIESIVGTPITTLHVGNVNLGLLYEMLTLMVDQRNSGLSKTAGKGQHIEDYRYFLANIGDEDLDVPIDLFKRNKNKSPAYIITQTGLTADPSLEGTLLLTTALLHLKNSSEVEDNNIYYQAESWSTHNVHQYDANDNNTRRNAMAIAFEELDHFANQQQSGFVQQMSGLDTLFCAHFWVISLIECNTVQTVLKFNAFCHMLAKRNRGSAKLRQLLSQSQGELSKRLLSEMSLSTDKHLPPFVLTAGRMDEIYSVFGLFNASSIAPSLIEPGLSSRNILNLKTDTRASLNAITSLWQLERNLFNNDNNAIYQSTHMLHQLLLKKRSPFQNTFDVSGDAFGVNFVI